MEAIRTLYIPDRYLLYRHKAEIKPEYEDNAVDIQDIIKLGIVTAVDNQKRLARVKFPGMGLQDTSGWLPVLINRDFIPDYDVPQRTEYESGGGGFGAYDSHKHDLIIKPYMPKVGEQVLAIYISVFNADGFILGGIQPWR